MQRSFRPLGLLSGGLAGLLLVPLLSAGAGGATEFPIASLGDIWFQADHAGFLEEDGGAVEEFYIRVTNNQLRFQEADDGSAWIGRVYVKLEFLDADEDRLGEASQRFEFLVDSEETATSADYAEILLVREPVDPRTASVEITLEDLNARKRGLLYVFTGKKRNGSARGMLAAPPFLEGGDFSTSDLQFAWSVGPAGDASDFEKNGLNVVPNPSRTYGLLQSEVSVYYEIYDRAAEAPAGSAPYEIRHEVLGPGDRAVYAERDTVRLGAGDWAQTIRFSARDFPTGQYVLRVGIRDIQGRRETVTERTFGLVWGTDAWNRTEQDILDEARVLFQEEEYERFREMSAPDRELYLAQFWAEHDPTPDTRQNELRDEFLRRVAHVNRHYSAFGQKGMLTDRGRIYIRFGEPDEIEREVVPTRDRQLDQLAPVLGEENPAARTLSTSDEVDVRPYEVWTYTTQGQPLFPEREFGTSVTGLTFVFVDETGTGYFVLRYTSDFINY